MCCWPQTTAPTKTSDCYFISVGKYHFEATDADPLNHTIYARALEKSYLKHASVENNTVRSVDLLAKETVLQFCLCIQPQWILNQTVKM